MGCQGERRAPGAAAFVFRGGGDDTAGAFVLRFWYTQVYVYGYLVPLVLAGYLSHLVMDSFNPQGVPWLWPVKKHFRLPLVKTGSLFERVVMMPAMLFLCSWLTWSVVR